MWRTHLSHVAQYELSRSVAIKSNCYKIPSPRMKTIKRFFNVAEAQFAKSALEAADIPAILLDENAFTMLSAYAPGGIRLQVDEADAEDALQILESNFEPPQEDK